DLTALTSWPLWPAVSWRQFFTVAHWRRSDGQPSTHTRQISVSIDKRLQAFGQVADVLRALQHDAELLGCENTAVTASKASLDLSQAAYAAGRGSLVQVLDAQRLYAQALQGYAHAKGQRYLDTVLLLEAMGGDSQTWLVSNASTQP